MKSTPAIDASAAFPDPMHLPGEGELAAPLGPAFKPVAEVFARLRARQPTMTAAWQYSPRCGWYEVQLLGKRRLLYLVPKRRDFRLAMILGRKAVAGMQGGRYGPRVARLLKTARHYPEGIAFEFNRTSLDPGLVAALLEAKIAPGDSSR